MLPQPEAGPTLVVCDVGECGFELFGDAGRRLVWGVSPAHPVHPRDQSHDPPNGDR